MPIPFHPLADLFPLIEGTEFDELVTSIREHGLRDPITLFGEKILDGRNRYRACQAAQVEPRFENYTGDDPISLVIDMNIHRRQLTPSQRALICAEMANLKDGQRADYAEAKAAGTGIPVPAITITKAAEKMGINKELVTDARRVLAQGTPEEIQAVRQGRAAVSTLAREIRRGASAEAADRQTLLAPKRSDRGGNVNRISTARVNADIWGQLRDAVINLTSLPHPAEVARIARFSDRAGVINARLLPALQYLKGFANEWSNSDQAGRAEEPAADDHADTGTGD